MVYHVDDSLLREETEIGIPEKVTRRISRDRLSTPTYISFDNDYVEVVLGRLSKEERRRKLCLDRKKKAQMPECLCHFSLNTADKCSCAKRKHDDEIIEAMCPRCMQPVSKCLCVENAVDDVIPECTCVCRCGNMGKKSCPCKCICFHNGHEDEEFAEEFEAFEEETSCSFVCHCSASDEKDCRCSCQCQEDESSECICWCQCDASDMEKCTCVCTCRLKEKRSIENEKPDLQKETEDLYEVEDTVVKCTCGCHYVGVDQEDFTCFCKRDGIGLYEIDENEFECQCSAIKQQDCSCICKYRRKNSFETDETRIEQEFESESTELCQCASAVTDRSPCLCPCPSDIKCNKCTCNKMNYSKMTSVNKMRKRLEELIKCKNYVMELNRQIIRENIHLENSEIKKLLYHPRTICLSELPIIEPNEIVIDRYITRLAVPSKSKTYDFKTVSRKKYRHSGTVCTMILPCLEKGCKVPSNPIPDIRFHEAGDCVQILGKYLNIDDYEHNYVSFWILDLLSLTIKRCQFQLVYNKNQKRFIQWFIYIFKTLQFTNSNRREIFDDLDQMILKSGEYMEQNLTHIIPSPHFAEYLLKSDETSEEVRTMVQRGSQRTYYGAASSVDEPSSSKRSARSTVDGKVSKTSSLLLRWSLESEDENDASEISINDTASPFIDPDVSKPILSDLVVVTNQLYFIFAQQWTHHILTHICRHPIEIKEIPLSRCMKLPPVQVPSYPPLFTTDCDEYLYKYNKICEEKVKQLKELFARSKKKRDKQKKDKDIDDNSDVNYEDAEDAEGNRDNRQSSDKSDDIENNRMDFSKKSPIPWKDLLTNDYNFSYNELTKPKCRCQPYNDSVLPLQAAISKTYFENFIPITYVEQAQASGDPDKIDLKLAYDKDERQPPQDEMSENTREQVNHALKTLLIQKERELKYEQRNEMFDEFLKDVERKKSEEEMYGKVSGKDNESEKQSKKSRRLRQSTDFSYSSKETSGNQRNVTNASLTKTVQSSPGVTNTRDLKTNQDKNTQTTEESKKRQRKKSFRSMMVKKTNEETQRKSRKDQIKEIKSNNNKTKALNANNKKKTLRLQTIRL
ncbi:hypothetical protein O3M35_012278 [Rhynocoris fuscipes]|uniref:Uncharacterized protein n=1 Tax=Rhynocoris fuscipes TaxID=488301 RepID=A0AAW1CRT1_9HEMI